MAVINAENSQITTAGNDADAIELIVNDNSSSLIILSNTQVTTQGSNSNGIEVAIGENNFLSIQLVAGVDVSVTGADSNAILLTPTGVTTTAEVLIGEGSICLLYTSPSPRDRG